MYKHLLFQQKTFLPFWKIHSCFLNFNFRRTAAFFLRTAKISRITLSIQEIFKFFSSDLSPGNPPFENENVDYEVEIKTFNPGGNIQTII